MTEERLITARELSAYLGISTGTLLDHWQAGHLPGFRLFGEHGPVRFRVAEVEAVLEQWRAGPKPIRNQ